MVLIESKSNPKAAYEFLAELTSYGKEDVTITSKYQPVVNTLNTRQICFIVTFPSEKEECILPTLENKKSKSIDSTKKRSSLHRLNNPNSSISQSKLSMNSYKPKQSLDLSNVSDLNALDDGYEDSPPPKK